MNLNINKKIKLYFKIYFCKKGRINSKFNKFIKNLNGNIKSSYKR